ncbi:hypothetical protein SAMN05661008_00882 [Alkalithermobacter thermoalcaliphilus JW-YL-7 = DSM 7308]|uniref:Transposase n=1 Tax=Alkalithermobacter thermoalcaliphilus JW-YL-7 = DSM 7308 TaxID=1121328 RepID=A0A150FQP8_CLOPD|nr:hypothetical protein JWYL7_0971 [[Clostridium] paradoxum JW-YL-7 = DSM 7308]SHK78276.1 hypothetical protein SAMN05661008_00882 [[Clostridium] paradoxum JW-YL-7 = DSM 7308]
MKKKFAKGKYEEAVEQAKELLDKGEGMQSIMDATGLTRDDVTKIQNKIKMELDDK